MGTKIILHAVLIVGLLLPLETLRAQVLPGVPESHIRAGRAEFSAEVLRAVNEVTGAWKRAWENDDARAVARLLSDEAVLVLPGGERIAGRDEIERALRERVLPSSGEVITRQLDLVGSGRMAVSSGRFWYQTDVEGEISDVSGHYVMVLLRDGRHWRIRSQLFSGDDSGLGL